MCFGGAEFVSTCVDFFTFILVQVLMRRQESERSVFVLEVTFKALRVLDRWIA